MWGVIIILSPLVLFLISCTTTLAADAEQPPLTVESEEGQLYPPIEDVFNDEENGLVQKIQERTFTLWPDLSYLNSHDPYVLEQCRMDIYAPIEGENFPVLIFMHGGGLTTGSKDEYIHLLLSQTFAEEGILVVNINYRLSPQVRFPAYVEDVANAFHWVKQRIANYGGDPERVFIAGHSAGAYLTAMVASDESYLARNGYTLADIAGALPISAQFYTHYTVNNERGISGRWQRNEAAPIFHAGSNLPAFLILYGAEEEQLYTKGAGDFHRALEDAGHPDATILAGSGRGHMDIVELIPERGDQFKDLIVDFIHSR